MTKRQMIEETHKALERNRQLPPEERIRRLIEKGTIDESGRVLMGRETPVEKPEEKK